MQRLGGGTGNTSGTATNPGANGSQSQLQQPNDQEAQRRTRRMEDQAQEENQPPPNGPPVFKGLDSVVVEVDKNPLKPRQIDTFSAAAASSYSAQLQMQQTQALAQAQQLQQLNQLQNQQQLQPQPQSTQDDSGMPPPTEQEKTRVQKLIMLIRSRNPYQLTRDGMLTLPGLSGIPLGGLSEMQATLRLEVDPMLQGLHFRLTRLPLRKTGRRACSPSATTSSSVTRPRSRR